MTTEELRRWAVEQAIGSIACNHVKSYTSDVIEIAQRLVDFVAPPSAEAPAVMPADFGRRIGEVGACSGPAIKAGMGMPLDLQGMFESESRREASRDAMAERQAIALWLGCAGLSWAAKRVTAGAHHQ